MIKLEYRTFESQMLGSRTGLLFLLIAAHVAAKGLINRRAFSNMGDESVFDKLASIGEIMLPSMV